MSTQKANQSVRLTKTVIDKLSPPDKGQVFVRDTDLKGFAVRITANGVRSFIVEKRVDGQVKRMTVGRYGELTVEQARKEAQKLLGKIAGGYNPAAEKQRQQMEAITLAQAYRKFLKTRELKDKTRYDYERLWQVAFPDWQNKKLLQITRAMVTKRHQDLGTQRGEAYANGAMRFLRSLFNFAQAIYDDGTGQPLVKYNPVNVLSQGRTWFRNERRKTVIKVHQLPAWFRAVLALGSAPVTDGAGTDEDKGPETVPDTGAGMGRDVADYLVLLLFTGLRKQEGLTLEWKNIDLKARSLLIPDPKNREPLNLPLSDFLHDLLSRRYEDAVNGYVFPGRGGKDHLIEPRNYVKQVNAESGVSFTLHDLRRTFITVAESLDIPPYAIKRLVNHKINGDVTAGYIVSDLERLRAPMQKITEFLLRASQQADTAPVIALAQHTR